MKFPFLASVIIFCLLLSYEIRKHRNLEQKAHDSFWEKEAKANATRRKPLDDLVYIQIPFEQLPMDILCEDPQISEYQSTLRELSTQPIVNLTGITNTDLKLQYGAPNIGLLSSYDQRYTLLVRTLQSWAEVLHKNDYSAQAQAVLEFAVQTRTDLSGTYRLLSSIYQDHQEYDKIHELIPIAQSLNSAMKDSIVSMLEDRCS